MRLLSQLKPKAVILTQHDGQYLGTIEDGKGSIPSVEEQAVLWRRAVTEFLGQMTAAGVRPGIILDDPTLPARPEECISRTGWIAACEPSRASALAAGRLLTSADRAAVASTRPSTRCSLRTTCCAIRPAVPSRSTTASSTPTPTISCSAPHA